MKKMRIVLLLCCVLIHCAIANKWRRTNAGGALNPVGLVWDSPTNSAYYVDLDKDSTQKCLYRYDAGEDKSYTARVDGHSLGSPISIIPVKSKPLSKFAVAFEDFVGLVEWDGVSDSARLIDEIVDLDDRLGPYERVGFSHRGSFGRTLYVGTHSVYRCGVPANQSVYSKQRGEGYRPILSNLKLPHGYAFTDDYLYVIDACTLKIWELKNSPSKGGHGEPRLAFSFKDIGKKPGHFFPTSLDIDNNGILYTVSYKTGEIWAIDPIAGKAHVVAELPTGGTIALKFAAGSGDLYVTVAKRIIDVTKRNVIGHQNPGTSLYQIRGIGRTFEFPRLRV